MKPPIPDEARNGRWPRVTFAVLCGLTAAFLWLLVTRVIHA
jgi:hypothetical protein